MTSGIVVSISCHLIYCTWHCPLLASPVFVPNLLLNIPRTVVLTSRLQNEDLFLLLQESKHLFFLYLKADLNLGLCLLHNLWNDSNIQVCMCGFANCCSIILLIMSSCYLAFRVSSLEQQLSFLNTQPTLPMRDRWAHTLTPTHRHTHNIYVLMYFHWPFITHNSYIDAHKGAYSLLPTEVQKFTQVKWVMFRDLSRTCLSKISIQTMQTACMSLTPHPRSFLSRRIQDGVFSTTTILKHGPLNPNNNDNLE